MKITGICGSSASSRRTRALIEAALEGTKIADSEIEVDLIDLSMETLDFCDGRPVDEYNEATQSVLEKIKISDGYLFGSPMYRGSMTGALKNLIDLIPNDSIKGKTAGLIATGGSAHHYLGLDLGFRTAMAFLQVHTIPGVLYFSHFNVNNGIITEDKVRQEANKLGADLVELTKMTKGKVLGPSLY